MMGRTSKQEPKEEIEVAEGGKPMSGAYIRSLVKQLTSSRATRGSRDSDETHQQEEQPVSEMPPPPHKKHVRRRLHTTRPYQERLLNMAEARREIVTALKFHRAAMKQAQEQEGKQYHRQQPPPPTPLPTQPSPNYPNYHQFDPSSIPLSPLYPYPPPHNPNLSSNQNPYSWPISSISPLPSSNIDSLALSLPNQTLGLNLNIRDFDNLYHNGSTTLPSIYSTSSPPLTSSSSSSSAMIVSQEAAGHASKVVAAADDQDMVVEEMRTLGERHQMEWNDRMNLVTSAWWFEFMKGVDQDGDRDDAVKRAAEECCGACSCRFEVFDEVMEFPPWLGGGESCLQPHLVDDCFSSDEYFQDVALPGMDIGEIDAIDGEWFS